MSCDHDKAGGEPAAFPPLAAARPDRFPGSYLLPSDPSARAVYDAKLGMLIVTERHHRVHGQIEDVERWAATLIAACWEARRIKRNERGSRG
ncbi:hypothetical protein FHS55_002098 [Angulomicrobium tetraedrale]|uniref:Uncharacterized protein n=1 Tax=Ancylobacter tetraedralis TaxID=217068 RepID=A0A839Z9U4_9HYPH|nr:hypothetical protein [Ancylobacter tetraedralis]MBB3771499.1 hypothetical protein [Ancylobacter tetraedralis]